MQFAMDKGTRLYYEIERLLMSMQRHKMCSKYIATVDAAAALT